MIDPGDMRSASWGGPLIAVIATSTASASTAALAPGKYLCLNASDSRMWFKRGNAGAVTAAVVAGGGTLANAGGCVNAGAMFWLEIPNDTTKDGIAAILESGAGSLVIMAPGAV